jgi:hypothetical protein
VRIIRITVPALLALALFSSGCVRRVPVNELLPPVDPPLSTDVLVDRINSYGKIQTFSAEVYIQFLNYFTGEGTKADKYPQTDGSIRFKRPEHTLMRVRFYGKKLSDMVSDGQNFKLAVYWPNDKRRFIFGSNLKELERMDVEELKRAKDKRLSQAGGLVNMRPQHITDSFLIKPISDADKQDVFREEVRQVEPDSRPGKKGLVERSYYVVYVLDRDEKGQARLRRKFWFDRSQPGTPLVRQQTFENGEGRLASDVLYSKWFKLTGATQTWPGKVIIDRRTDGYRLDLDLVPDSIEINGELPETTFNLANTEHLEELDLDQPRKPESKPAAATSNANRRSPSPRR